MICGLPGTASCPPPGDIDIPSLAIPNYYHRLSLAYRLQVGYF
ncbi:hypothetical protein I542_0983 [Mycobacteroides abscessus 1948]|uniref:Uncharacterized protein n=1 Tax=Mycobacteroides abscessus 1948 TaxID=1299323 RepID=A0A829QDH2_9MYCO|nr:hypothetical protein I542_0983 [Mycobacteroides abscessus 1948]